jgi:predicted dinucleotide-binding enzyme
MKVGVLGTGWVGRTLAAKIASLDHEVTMGARDPAALMAREGGEAQGAESFASWHAAHPHVRVATFREAADAAELVFNATSGAGSLAALRMAGPDALRGKVLVDVANPLDFSRGRPPTLLVANTDSLAEQIQRELPETRVVTSLNTIPAELMVDPGRLAGGRHHVFVSGNELEAKAQVTGILREWFGWSEVIDLGDITSARGVEMYLALWVRLLGAMGGRVFNVRVVTADG